MGNNLRWVLMGDFNYVLKLEDRIRGNQVSIAEVVDFHSCVDNYNLLELPHQGSHYTWNDK